MSSRTTIELNGKQYDALTGSLITSSMPIATPKKELVKPVTHGLSMDGFSQSRPVAPRSQPAKIKRTAVPQHINPRRPEKSKTLMRTVVKKPEAHKIAPKIEAAAIKKQLGASNERLGRAHAIQKSQLVAKFSPNHHSALTKKVAPVPVVKPAKSALVHHNTPVEHMTTHRRSDIFTEALRTATSHEQPHYKKQKTHHKIARKLGVSNRGMSVGAAGLAAVLLIGFVAFQNAPNFAMRVAASRAGVSAQMPGYKPSGFAMNGPIQYSPGQITVNFKSNTDNRSYAVAQRTSHWNNEALLKNYVAVDDRPYQTYQEKGKTIYIYDNSSATWVNGGIWYQIEGDSQLTSDQLLRIASSI